MVLKYVPKKLILLVLISQIYAQSNHQIQLNLFTNENNIQFLNKNSNGIYNNEKILNNIIFQNNIILDKFSFLEIKSNWYLNSDTIQLNEISSIFSLEKLKIKIGSFNNEKLYENPNFSSGSMVFSNNARKIPGISFNSNWRNFFNFFEYKAEIFHGKFSKPLGYNDGPYLHYKSVLLKKKFENLNLGFSIQHAVQHGGYDQNNEKIPSGWDNFINVFFARSGDESQPGQDQDYKAGNGLGSFTFFLEKNNTQLYYEHFFDDKSGVKTLNFGDGLLGVNFESSSFDFNLEVINTRDQSGNQHPPGVDSYYYHDVYTFGWSIDNLSIGNSFIHPNSNRKLIYNLGFEKFLNQYSIIARYANARVYTPYQDKNGNQPYENYNDLIEKDEYVLLGINYFTKSENIISINFASENQSQNIKISYLLNL